MSNAAVDREEFVRRGQAHYDRVLRARLEPEHKGEFLVLHVDSGDYELNPSQREALERAKARHPDGLFYILRIGHRTAARIGAQSRREHGWRSSRAAVCIEPLDSA